MTTQPDRSSTSTPPGGTRCHLPSFSESNISLSGSDLGTRCYILSDAPFKAGTCKEAKPVFGVIFGLSQEIMSSGVMFADDSFFAIYSELTEYTGMIFGPGSCAPSFDCSLGLTEKRFVQGSSCTRTWRNVCF